MSLALDVVKPLSTRYRSCVPACGAAAAHGPCAGALVRKTQTFVLSAQRDQGVAFKRGVWKHSAPAGMCKSWFYSCNRHRKSGCLGMSSCRVPAPALSAQSSGKKPDFGNFETCCSCCWVHSPRLCLSLMLFLLLLFIPSHLGGLSILHRQPPCWRGKRRAAHRALLLFPVP